MVNIYKISFKALRRVIEKSWPLSDALARDERINTLDDADKELVVKLLNETLRHFGEITAFIKDVDLILALGVSAMKILNIPPKQVIGQLCELSENPKYRAILNRLSQKQFKPNVKLNYPNWMLGSWRKAYGEAAVKQIVETMMQQPETSDIGHFFPSTDTGNIAAQPEILIHCGIGNVKPMVALQNKMLEEQHEKMTQREVVTYANFSLQYEEGEGLVKKLDPKKWRVISQERILPCLDSTGNAIAGGYKAHLEKL